MTCAALGLARAASDLRGGVGGWGGVVAIGFAGGATFLALVSSTLANLVVRHRSWRAGYLLVTLGAAVFLVLRAVRTDRAAETLATLAAVLALGLALWLPVGARWWLDRSTAPPLGRRAALAAGAVVGFVVAVAGGVVLTVLGAALPGGLVGPVVLLVAVAAFASGRVADTFALALLAAVAVCVVLFELGSLPEGRLVIGAVALAVLVTFAWRPAAVRLSRARGAARLAAIPAEARRTASSGASGTPAEPDATGSDEHGKVSD